MKRISKTEIKEMRSQSKKNSIMFAFTLPTVILYTIFFLVTMLIGVYYSFTDWNGISKDYTFVGLKNYVKVLTDERFREALWFNIGYTIALVVLLIVIPLTIALALNRIRRLSTLFRSIYFIPAVISMVTVGLIWNELFYRAVPAIGEMLNIEALSTSPLGNPKLAAIAIMVVNIWQGCAIPTVLFIAGLQSVPKDLLEAATIDGAGNWARFWNVIIPYLIPVLNMVIITQAKAGLTVFDYIKVMTNGGPVMIPQFKIIKYMGLIDTKSSLVAVGIFNAFGTFLLRQFFLTIPKELEEAAKIDGCSYPRIFWEVILKNSKPALMTLIIFTFMNTWNDFLRPLIFINSEEKWTLAMGLAQFQGTYVSQWNQMMAGALISMLPILLVYIFAQKYFVQGIVMSGIKG